MVQLCLIVEAVSCAYASISEFCCCCDVQGTVSDDKVDNAFVVGNKIEHDNSGEVQCSIVITMLLSGLSLDCILLESP